VSLSIYWWPNAFTHLPYLPRDGRRNPEAKDYDAPRLTAMIQAVSTLAAAGEAETDARALLWLRAWFSTPATRMAPHLTYAQQMPGLAAGGRQGIIEGLPIVLQLLDALAALEARSALPAEDRLALRSWLGEYLAWLLSSSPGRSEAARPNNHGTWYDVATCAIARSLNLPQLEKAALARAEARLAGQFLSNGQQPYELSRQHSLDYSLYNLTAWAKLETLGQAHRISFHARGPKQAASYLRQQAATWPAGRSSREPGELLRRLPP
jgi:hypothetical protein